jgi:uncharacterized membrane protein (UPF0182 family)
MRQPRDLPRRRRGTTRGRLLVVAAAALVLVLLTFTRGIAGFYTDYLWFGELRQTNVWKGMLGAKIGLAVAFSLVFFAAMWASLAIADRIAPRFRIPSGPEDELVQRYRDAVGRHTGKVRTAVAIVFALLVGTGASGQWNKWILFRNSVSFGTRDPQFHRDISYFVFRLPFLAFVVSWAFVALVMILLVTVVFHYLNGGIRLQTPGQRVTPQVKAHISVLLGCLALVKAAGYYLQRFELDFSTRGVVRGATYTDVKAQLPALTLLVLISLVAFGLFVYNIRLQGWVLPILGVGLWAFVSVIVGAVYPAFIQKFRVQPSELTRERTYIARNIASTRDAMGLTKVTEAPFNYQDNLTAGDLAHNVGTVRNVRLWDPAFTGNTFTLLQEIKAYYRFSQLSLDRYNLSGELTQTIVSARELNPGDLPSQSWVNRKLQYTHGYGALMAAANAVTVEGKPDFVIQNIPPESVHGAPPLDAQPRIYYGRGTGSYVVVNTDQKEIDYQRADGSNVESTYEGKGGVRMGSIFRRAAFALRFGDINPLISGLIRPSSRAMFIRDISSRVRKAAPFLRYDADPYPVIVKGRLLWVQDAYTTTTRYPYSATADLNGVPDASGLHGGLSYIRNSVKVVVDAYDGTTTFYLFDKLDPLALAYGRAFPGLFTPADRMDPELKSHLRYPEDLFRVQTNMYGRYHITRSDDFYNAADAWNVSQDPGSGSPSAELQVTATTNAQGLQVGAARVRRIDPAYLLMRLPNDQQDSFLILRPFVPVSAGDKQKELTAFMTAKSDASDYGKIQVFVMPRGLHIDGPSLVDSRIAADAAISKEISLLNTQGSQVLLGNVLVIPIERSIIYVRPLYVQSQRSPFPELKDVIVVYAGKAAMRPTLQEALTAVFGNAPPTREQTGPPGPPSAVTTPTTPGVSSNVASLLDQAKAAFDQANTDLRNGDLAAYQRDNQKGVDLVNQARAQSGGGAPGGGGGTTTTTAPTQGTA